MNITTRKSISTNKGCAIFDINTAYTSKKGKQLLQQYCILPQSDFFDLYYRRFSEDNGKTWSPSELIYKPEVTEKGTWRYSESAIFYDKEQDAIIFFYNYALFPKDKYSSSRDQTLRIYYRISKDNGHTFSKPIQLIADGFNELNWAKDISYGQNCALVSFCRPLKIKNKIFLPVAISSKKSKEQLDGSLSASCFIGEWNGVQILWEKSETLTISKDLSLRGLCEPTIAELKDGRLLMVMRASNGGGYGVVSDMPSYKWYTISNDSGKTWKALGEDVKAWTYSNNEHFFSPASGSCLIRSSKNKKLYWVGNITNENPQGNLPRRPLVILEIDEITACPIKKTLKVILDKKENELDSIQFSNLRLYEDRISGEFVINMPHIGMYPCTKEKFDLSSPGYEHRFDPTIK